MLRYFTAVARTLVVGMLMALAGSATAQQAYPTKPIRLIVPYPPGGSATILSRLVGQRLTESWGQPVIVDSRGGGNSIIGTEALVRSVPDGYTLILNSSAHVVIPQLIPTSYDAIKDFAPVATVVSTQPVLLLHPSVPASNLQEFIALAKSRPGQLNYATSGSGTPNQLASELFNIMAGVRMQHIPYKGGGPAINDLIGGQVQLLFVTPINVIAHIKSGRLKAIAYAGETRLPALPQVPTFTEAGLPGFDVKAWYGILAPASTSKEIIDKLSSEIGRFLANPDFKEKVVGQGMDPFLSTPEQFAALIRADIAKYGKVIKAANIKLEQ